MTDENIYGMDVGKGIARVVFEEIFGFDVPALRMPIGTYVIKVDTRLVGFGFLQAKYEPGVAKQ